MGSWAQHSDAQVATYTSKSQLKTVTKSEVGSVRMGRFPPQARVLPTHASHHCGDPHKHTRDLLSSGYLITMPLLGAKSHMMGR